MIASKSGKTAIAAIAVGIVILVSSLLYVSMTPKPLTGVNVAVYDDDPVISGFCTPENAEKIAGSVSLMSISAGSGRIIVFVDDPVFRGCWYGTNKLLMNAVFFGSRM